MVYIDYAKAVETKAEPVNSKESIEPSFPERLHFVLEQAESEGYEDLISWQPHGRAFVVHDSEKLTEKVLKL